jgi:hypothetical protein
VKNSPLLAGGLMLVAASALAHPHFNKTIVAKLAPGVEVTIVYDTTPAHEARAQGVKVGEFVTPRRPVLKLSSELKAGKTTLPAGEYTIGVIKTSDKDWTMALYPGRLGRADTPDAAKALRLDSRFSTAHGTAEHMLIDITPGEGTFEGKAVLTLHFGTLHLAGVLAEGGEAPAAPRPPAAASTPTKP